MNHTIYPLYNGSFNILMKSARSMEDIHCFAFLVVDENGEVLREIPTEEAMEMLANLQNSAGAILDRYI